MNTIRAKVFYQVKDPAEVSDRIPAAAYERWTDEPTAGRYIQDRHTRYTVLLLKENSPAAVEAALKAKHPLRVVSVDQIEWLPAFAGV